jgi:hypothetical protein
MPIPLTAADRLDGTAAGFELGVDDYLTKARQGPYTQAPAAAPAPGVSDGTPSASP